jgi:hypothetical protein
MKARHARKGPEAEFDCAARDLADEYMGEDYQGKHRDDTPTALARDIFNRPGLWAA